MRRQNVTTRRERPRSTLGIGQAYDDVVTLAAAADVNESVVPRSSSFLSQLELPRHDNSHDVIKQSRDVNRLLHVRRVRQRNVYMYARKLCHTKVWRYDVPHAAMDSTLAYREEELLLEIKHAVGAHDLSCCCF